MYTTNDLLQYVYNNRLLAPHFLGVYSIDCLPLYICKSLLPTGFIVNTDSSNLPGKHWIAIILLANGQGEFFYSFGVHPPTRLQIWLNKHCIRGWHSVNDICIQNPFSTICGLYCLYFFYSRLVLKHSASDIIRKLVARKDRADSFVIRKCNTFFN